MTIQVIIKSDNYTVNRSEVGLREKKMIATAFLISLTEKQEKLKFLKHKREKGILLVFPSITPFYEKKESTSTFDTKSKTEKALTDREEKLEALEQEIIGIATEIEFMINVLNCLEPMEKKLVEQQFLKGKSIKKAYQVYSDLHIGKTLFHSIKTSAMTKIANRLLELQI